MADGDGNRVEVATVPPDPPPLSKPLSVVDGSKEVENVDEVDEDERVELWWVLVEECLVEIVELWCFEVDVFGS